MMALDLNNPPVVLERPGREETMFLGGGLAALVIAICFAFAPQFRFAALPLGGIAIILILLGIVQRARPTLLRLGPEGLDYGILGIQRHWVWRDIDFRLVRVRNGTAAAFDVRRDGGSGQFAISAYFELSPDKLVLLLNEAQGRWSSATLVRRQQTRDLKIP